jgi:alpha,alpha-trehalase
VKSHIARALLFLLLAPTAANSQQHAMPPSPQELFPDLFGAVETQKVFADGKLFADAVPREAPAAILRLYLQQKPQSVAALKSFVVEHFDLPADTASSSAPPDRVSMIEHIDRLWPVLTRTTTAASLYSSSLPLPRPYVVPGGRFREMYYWDSYFTMLGLAQSGRGDLVRDMTDDFAYLIDHYGHIPNGARTYYLGRSQPPFFFLMVALTDPQDSARAFAHYLPQLRREYGYWMEGSARLKRGTAHRRVVSLPGGVLLNRYWDDKDAPRDESFAEDTDLQHSSGRPPGPLYRDIRAAAESGWDFSSRWFADEKSLASIDTTQIVPIDLNSLLFGLESAIRDGCRRVKELACSAQFERRAAARHAAIDHYLWDSAAGDYQDYRWTRQQRTGRVSAAMLYPLFVGAASSVQAARVAGEVRRDLLKPGGLVTTPIDTGQQWDAPNGWAPLQWIAVAGLRDSGQKPLADTIACRWMVTVNAVFMRTGKLVEKYDVVDIERRGGGGEYPLQDGFGWTNGVMRQLTALYPDNDALTSPTQCPEHS